MPVTEAELKRRLSGGTLADWTLRDAGGVDDLPTDPVSDAVVRAQLNLTLSALRDAITGAIQATQTAQRYGGGKTPVTATVAAEGDTTIHTPAAGKKVRLSWVTAINDPDESLSPVISVKIGALECYRGYALSHWEVFDGAVDAALVINLSHAASVAVTAHLEEI